MALGDESFFNKLGEEISRASLVQIMIDYFDEKLGEEVTEITDFNEGSEIRNILEGIAVDVFHLEQNDNEQSLIAFIETAYGIYLDKHGEKYDIYRDEGSESVGVLEFTVPKALSSEIIIPEGTVCVSEITGIQYLTSVEVILQVGETSVSAPAHSFVTGKDTNAEANTITLFFDTAPDNSMAVTNPEKFAGGRDYEEDDDFRKRIQSTAKQDSFGSVSYYMNLGANIDGVHDVYLAEDQAGDYTQLVVVNGDDKPTTDEVMIQTLAQFTRQENIILKHKFGVVRPSYITVDLQMEVYVYSLLDNTDFKDCLSALFDGGTYDATKFPGLCIGESLSTNRLISVIENIGNVSNVRWIKMKGSDDQYYNLSDYIYARGSQVLKVGNLDIQQKVVLE